MPDELTPTIAVDAKVMVPRDFIREPDVRLETHRRLARTETIGALEELAEELTDRCGTLPRPLLRLIDMTRLRLLCEQHGIASVHAGPNGIAITKVDGTRRMCDLFASPAADRPQQVLAEVRSWCERRFSSAEPSRSPTPS